MSNNENPTPEPKRSIGRTIARNTMFGLGAQMALKAASFLFTLLVINNLGGEHFGQYSQVLAWAMLFSVIGDLGISQYFTREVARDPGSSELLFWNVVALRFILAVIAAIVTTVGATAYGFSSEIVLGIFIFTLSYFFQSVFAPIRSLFVGHERIDLSSIYEVITQVLFMVFGTVALLLGGNFIWLVVAAVLNIPIVSILAWQTMRRAKLGPPRFKLTPETWLALIRAGLPFAFMQLALSFSYRLDTIILSKHVTDTDIGWYNAAYNLTLTLLTLTRAFTDAVLPSFSREHMSNPTVVRDWYFRSVKGMAFLGLPIAIGGLLLSNQISHTIFKPALQPAAICLAILVLDIPFNIYHAFCGHVASSIKQERKASIIFMSMGLANLVINLILIPQFGIIGSSFATVLTDAFGAMQFYFLFRHEFGAGLQFRRLSRFALAAGVMGVMLLVLQNFNVFVLIALGAVCYLGIVWISGAYSPDERARMTGMITRRLGFASRG